MIFVKVKKKEFSGTILNPWQKASALLIPYICINDAKPYGSKSVLYANVGMHADILTQSKTICK